MDHRPKHKIQNYGSPIRPGRKPRGPAEWQWLFRYKIKAKFMQKIDKLDFLEIKDFCFLKDNVKRMRRQGTDWEKIFAKDTSDKGMLSRIHEELLKLNNKKTNT